MSTHYQTLGMEQDVGMALSPQAEMMRGHRSMSADFSRIDNLTSQTETEHEVYSKGSCQFCCEGFGLLKKRHFCKVCGLALCKSCSTTDLLVYVPDNQLHKESTGSVDTSGIDPCLAIIKIIGCPEVEPEVSLYLRVCSECREELVRRQVDKCQNEEDAPSGLDMMQELATLHEKFSTAERNVNHQLREYQEIVESLEDNSRRSNNQQAANGTSSSRNSLHSNMRTLAKAQGDLTDILADHVMVIQRLKRLAIISAHLYLRQLVYEVIHLCDKFELQEKAPQLLVKVEGVVEQEVGTCLKKDGEDLDQHLELMKEMIRTQMKACYVLQF
nr:hypothetical protein BaRGS_019868 [Batillaria attramentaria]